MKNIQISILIVNYNSSDFIKISLKSLALLTKNKFKVYIADNNSSIKDYRKLERIVGDYKNVYLTRRENTTGQASLDHGNALDYLFKKVKTPYFSVLDADALWLKKNWDEILIKKINNKVKLIGTQAPKPKPQDFPLMFSILLETKTFRDLKVSFLPKDINKKQDTGYQLREKYLENNFEGKLIEMKNTRTYKKGPFRELIVAEYYLNKDYEHIFASHFGRGSTLGDNKYKKKTFFLFRIPWFGQFLRRIRGKTEKYKWIKICEKIIYEQI